MELHHENVVELRYVIQSESEGETVLYLAFEYCEFDLYALLYMPKAPKLSRNEVLSLIKQFLIALHMCAVHNVVHRDLKPANILVTSKWVLKLGDFGLARKLADHGRYSDKVITLWYRPPELLLGSTKYGVEVDIWSAGCILFEMVTGRPLFQATQNTEASQLVAVFALCGPPTFENWPELREFEGSVMWPTVTASSKNHSHLLNHLKDHVPEWCSGIIDLLMKMLQLNPHKRITVEEAINHQFIREMDRETDPDRIAASGVVRDEMHQARASDMRRTEIKEKRDRALMAKAEKNLPGDVV
jgi:serine/threonine protein kinase